MKSSSHAPKHSFSELSPNFKNYHPLGSANPFTRHKDFIDQVTDLTPSLIAVYNLQTGKYVFINKSLKPMLGYEADDWITKGVKFVTSKVHPEDLPRIILENQKALERDKKLKSKDPEIVEFKYRLMHSNGSYRWLKTYGTVFDRDEEGRVQHVINISMDITEIKQTEEKLLRLTNKLEQEIEDRTKELKASEKKFRVLIENSSDGILLASSLDKITYASPAIKAILGYSPKELLSIKSPITLVHEDDRKSIVKLFTRNFKKPGDKLTTRLRILHKKGKFRWIEVVASNLINDSSINSVVLNFRDITEQLLSQKKQEREIQYAAFRLHIQDVLSQNNDLNKALGLCVNAVVDQLEAVLSRIWVFDEKTKTLRLLASSNPKETSDNGKVQSVWEKARDGKIALDNKPYLTNDAVNDKDILNKKWIKKNKIKAFAGYPLVLDNKIIGAMTAFFPSAVNPQSHHALHSVANTIAQGIGRKFAENALVESEKKYHTIFASLAEGIILQDTRGRILAANSSAERILNINIDQMVERFEDKQKRSTYIWEDGSLLPEDKFPFVQALITGLPQKDIRMGIIKDKKTFWILVNSIPLKNSAGKTYAVASSFQDITSQKELERQKDEFISIASHELKTPLTTIKSFNEILKSQFKEEQKAQYYLDKMDNEIFRLTELVNELLDVSKIQYGRLSLIKESVNIDQLIKEAIEDLQYTSHHHKIIQKNKVNLKVSLDKYRIYQVIMNLVSNAVKYSPQSNKVIISAKKRKDDVMISVQDFGIGITERDKQKVFDPFFQATTTIRRSHSGLGLGLHIVKEIITAHGGEVKVKSQKGEGSTFYFTIPING